MTNRLRFEEFVPYAPDEPGTVSVHHCKGGPQNDRLYITRKDDGNILAYCHHCGKSGAYSEAYSRVKQAKSKSKGAQSYKRYSGRISLPRDSTLEEGDWPARASIWIRRAGIPKDTQRAAGIVYSPKYDRVIIPIYDSGDLVGYQARRLTDDRSQPKYITITNNPDRMLWVSAPNVQRSVVICEDVLSAIRCSEVTNSVALLGTKLSDRALNHLTQFDKFYLWLDNDKPEVKKAQVTIKNRLSLFGDVVILKTDREPKEMTVEEIKSCLSL